MYGHILVTLDGSELSESILPHVEKLAAGTPLRVTLLAVAEDPEPISSPARVNRERLIDAAGAMQETTLQEIDIRRDGETHEQAIQRVESELRTYLEDQARRLSEKGIPVNCIVAMGSPAALIVEHANTENVDAIAMASHGRRGLAQLIFGSVAGKVIARAGRPVIVVRPDGLEA